MSAVPQCILLYRSRPPSTVATITASTTKASFSTSGLRIIVTRVHVEFDKWCAVLTKRHSIFSLSGAVLPSQTVASPHTAGPREDQRAEPPAAGDGSSGCPPCSLPPRQWDECRHTAIPTDALNESVEDGRKSWCCRPGVGLC